MADLHFEYLLKEILDGTKAFAPTDEDLFVDRFQTREQRDRDVKVTALLNGYVEAYEAKRKFQAEKRDTLFDTCVYSVIGFSVVFAIVILRFIASPQLVDTPNVVSFVSACVSFLTLIIGLLHIITKYCFPENDEKYITQIVQAIQQNDLKHKLANIEYNQKKNAETQNSKD